jgi:hypothetical protein
MRLPVVCGQVLATSDLARPFKGLRCSLAVRLGPLRAAFHRYPRAACRSALISSFLLPRNHLETAATAPGCVGACAWPRGFANGGPESRPSPSPLGGIFKLKIRARQLEPDSDGARLGGSRTRPALPKAPTPAGAMRGTGIALGRTFKNRGRRLIMIPGAVVSWGNFRTRTPLKL